VAYGILSAVNPTIAPVSVALLHFPPIEQNGFHLSRAAVSLNVTSFARNLLGTKTDKLSPILTQTLLVLVKTLANGSLFQ